MGEFRNKRFQFKSRFELLSKSKYSKTPWDTINLAKKIQCILKCSILGCNVCISVPNHLKISVPWGLYFILSPDFSPDFGPHLGLVFGMDFRPEFGPDFGPDFCQDFDPDFRNAQF